MSKYLTSFASIFVLTLMIGALQAVPAKAGATVDDATVCLCFGGPLNGFNATKSPDGINCPRRTTGPFCFIENNFMPLYWKVYVFNQRQVDFPSGNPTSFAQRQNTVDCPPGKMVLSCGGGVSGAPVGQGGLADTAARLNWNIAPIPALPQLGPQTGCRIIVRDDGDSFGEPVWIWVWAFCASPGPGYVVPMF
jgi:hypothetical protein